MNLLEKSFRTLKKAVSRPLENYMKFLKYLFIGLLILVVGGWALKLVFGLAFGLLGLVLKLALPVIIVAGLGYVAYKMFSRNDKSLDGSRRQLP